MSWNVSKPRIACVASSAAAARAAQAELAARYELIAPGNCEVRVALGAEEALRFGEERLLGTVAVFIEKPLQHVEKLVHRHPVRDAARRVNRDARADGRAHEPE